ncbi:MAG: hypothetical protein ACOYD5_03505 [Negativicutes bacterium]|jgi:hypothetical protein
MRQLTDAELLSLTKMLEMETHSLAVAKTSIMAISDEQLKTLAQSGITAAEARVTGLQQFINENRIAGIETSNNIQ